MRKLWIAVALLLAMVAGIIFGQALIAGGTARAWYGVPILLAALLVFVSVLRARRVPVSANGPARPSQIPPWSSGRPRLGELLVRELGLIQERELKIALERQRGTTRRLGEILVEQGSISRRQLREVLAKHHAVEVNEAGDEAASEASLTGPKARANP
jgi:hypothetical protein